MNLKLKINEKDSYRALGQLVRYRRHEKQFSLRDLSSLSNISHTLISNIEKGKVVSHPDTLQELLKILDIEFIKDGLIIEEFKGLYDEALNYLFEYEYSKAEVVMNQLISNEDKYLNSIVTSDYIVLKLLYLALTDKIYGNNVDMIERYKKVYDYLGPYQKQIFSLAYGVYKYNYGLYSESYKNLVTAKEFGSDELSLLVDVFLVKAYVKMYRFMDAVSLSNQLIKELENDLLYLRAMEVRLSIAYAYIIVLKFDDALELLNKVYRFAKFYNTIHILSECDLLYGTIYFKQKKYDLAEIKMNNVITDGMFVTYIKMKLGFIRNDNEEVEKYYQEFMDSNRERGFLKSEYLMNIVMSDLKLKPLPEKELVKMYNYLIKFGKESIDLELLDAAYSLYIKHCKTQKHYKQALELSEDALGIRKFGVNFKKGSK